MRFRIAIALSFLSLPGIQAQDAAAVARWNQTLAEVLKASKDPIGQLTPDVLACGQTAANALLAAEKPTLVTAERWRLTQASAYKVLGWVGVMDMHGGHPAEDFLRSLQLDPTDATISLRLAAILQQENPPREAESLFHEARAAEYAGPGSLPDRDRQRLEANLQNHFEGYHGRDPEVLDKLKLLARNQALPPADFALEPRYKRISIGSKK